MFIGCTHVGGREMGGGGDEGKCWKDSATGWEGQYQRLVIRWVLLLGCGAHGLHVTCPALRVCSGPAFHLGLEDIRWW